MSPANALAYRPDIDGLRAIAVLSVLVFHLFPHLLPGGFVGVDIFFVISGYLITGILMRELETGQFSIAGFYERRIRRIFPALIVVLMATTVAGWCFMLPHEWRYFGKYLWTSGVFGGNLLAASETGYFAVSAENKPLLHLWSLGIEEQFYILWPAILFLLKKLRPNVVVPIGFLLIFSFSGNVLGITSAPVPTFFFPLPRIWELLVGALLAQEEVTAGILENKKISRYLGALGCLLLLSGVFLINGTKPFPGWWALVPVLGACALICGHPGGGVNRLALGAPALVAIGRFSYPLYLWHWPLIYFDQLMYSGERTVLRGILIAALSLILAFLTYRVLERKIRYARSPGLLPTLMGLMLALVFIGAESHLEIISAHNDTPAIRKVLQASGEWNYPDSRNGKYRVSEGSGSVSALFFGDSNAEQYWPRVSRLVNQGRFPGNVLWITGGGCPPLPNISEIQHPHCPEVFQSFMHAVQSSDVRKVVISAQWSGYFRHNSSYLFQGSSIEAGGEAFDNALSQWGELLRSISSAGKRVYVVLNIPTGTQLSPEGLIERRWVGSPEILHQGIDRDTYERRNMALNRLRDVAVQAGATVIDPLDYLCDKNFCPAMNHDGEPMYKDATHLRPSYVRDHVFFLDPIFSD